MTGLGDGRFNPNGNITRQEFAVMLWRYAMNVVGLIDEGRQTPQWTQFSDYNQIASWAYGHLRWANYAGIITGSGGAINPTGNATRAEAAVMMMRFINVLEGNGPTPQGVNIAPLLGRNFEEVRHYFGDGGTPILGGEWNFNNGVIVWLSTDNFGAPILNSPIGTIWVFFDHPDTTSANTANPTAFRWNNIDGTSTRDDVRAQLGAPDRYYRWGSAGDGPGITYEFTIDGYEIGLSFHDNGHMDMMWWRPCFW